MTRRIIEVRPRQVNSHSCFSFWSSIFTVKLIVSRIVRNFNNLLVIVPYFRVSAKNCLRTQFGLASRPRLRAIIKQLLDWCMPKLQRMFPFAVGQSGDTVTTLSWEQAESLRVTDTTINLIPITLQCAPSQGTNILYFFIFFHWHYIPLWALACRTRSFRFLLSVTNPLHHH
jgi:hypothetical protein